MPKCIICGQRTWIKKLSCTCRAEQLRIKAKAHPVSVLGSDTAYGRSMASSSEHLNVISDIQKPNQKEEIYTPPECLPFLCNNSPSCTDKSYSSGSIETCSNSSGDNNYSE